MSDITAQEIFDKVATHLSAQGHKALSDSGACYYLTTDGDKCALGCLIPDNEYEYRFETHDAASVLKNLIDPFHYPVLNSLKKYEALILDLQNNHDAENSDLIQHRLILTASKHNLDAGIIARLPWPEVWQ